MDRKTLIICASVHHGNTLKVAKAMGKVLDAKTIKPSEVDMETLSRYDLIGFGSGIYNGKHHRTLFELLKKIRAQNHQKTFVFSTATVPMLVMHKEFNKILAEKGFDTAGEFQCKGFINYGFTKYFGGLNKGRPNTEDLKKAEDFAQGMYDAMDNF